MRRFPCQPFSTWITKGFTDTRSNVFRKYYEILKHHKPKYVILENVKNLQSHDKGNTFKTIYDNLTKLNYYIKYKVLNTSSITEVPQNRERIYIVCFKNKDEYDRFEFNFPKTQIKPIKDYLESDIKDKYYYSNKFKVFDKIKEGVTKNIDQNVIYQYRRYYVRENKNKVCPTLTMGVEDIMFL